MPLSCNRSSIWWRKMQLQGIFEDFLQQIFYHIHIRQEISLQYYIYVEITLYDRNGILIIVETWSDYKIDHGVIKRLKIRRKMAYGRCNAKHEQIKLERLVQCFFFHLSSQG